MEFFLIVWIGSALLAAYLAGNRGRNAIAWGIAGFFFGIFALVGILLVGDSDEKKARLYRGEWNR